MKSNRKYYIQTFGCQMNERDSETIAGVLDNMGYKPSNKKDDANIVLINTCSIRENADNRFFGVLGQLKNRKKNEKDFIVGVCGCMMQQQFLVDLVKEKYPWVDIIFGTHNIHNLEKLISNLENEKKRQIEVMEDAYKIVEGLPANRLYSHKAFVNIMKGCNNFCTYCVVPYTRGREISRQPDEILNEIKGLVESGTKEVTLLGQNVNSYRGFGGVDFPKLLDRIGKIDGLEIVRFMTSHPKDLSPDLIRQFETNSKLARHLHLPIQSGSNYVLKKMNRGYTREHYLEILSNLKVVAPDVGITTDIIVGFPGEREEDFEETLSLIKEVSFDSAFTFIYSQREGTPAKSFEDQIPEDIKHERFNRLVDVINESSLMRNRAQVGKIQKVLVDGYSKSGEDMFNGRTSQFKLINFPAKDLSVGDIKEVKVVDANTFSLTGQLV